MIINKDNEYMDIKFTPKWRSVLDYINNKDSPYRKQYEPRNEISYNVVCTTSKASDQASGFKT